MEDPVQIKSVESANPIPIDLFKWLLSIAIGLVVFCGSIYNRRYFSIFGIREFVESGDPIRIATDAFAVIFRPAFISVTVFLTVMAVLAARYYSRFRNQILLAYLGLLFLAAGLVARWEAVVDVRRLLNGESGRRAWCDLKADRFDKTIISDFKMVTDANGFRLVLQSKDIIVLANERTKEQIRNDETIQVFMLHQEDISHCRFSGERM